MLERDKLLYSEILKNIKNKINTASFKANLCVNVEMICLYWYIGKEILEKQSKYGWGSKIIDNLSKDLINSFPNMKGLSTRNLKYMRKFAETYDDFEFVQQAAAQIPWFHNVAIMENIKNSNERLFYIKATINNGWSRNVLIFQIDSDLYKRQIGNKENKTNNFELTLPKLDSELAIEIVKDPYKFEFLNLTAEVKELEIEKSLISHMREFLLELGTGFAFVGEQYHLEIGNEDFYIDLLFYNLKLRCFVVIELKTGDFKPEYVGKLNFYLTGVDAKLKHKEDRPTIGLLLCKNKNKTIAQYSLAKVNNPISVAEYTTSKRKQQNDINDSLPSTTEIEQELDKIKTK